jgi:hypothetical protein
VKYASSHRTTHDQDSSGLEPSLERWLKKDAHIKGTRVYLGLHNAYFAHSPGKGTATNWGGRLDLQKEYRARLSDGCWTRDPTIVAFGWDGAWIVVGSKGDFVWDLKGHYKKLEEILNAAEYGIEVCLIVCERTVES